MDPRSIRTDRTQATARTVRREGSGISQQTGKVLAATVVAVEKNGEVRLAVGREQLSVQSDKPLQPGDRLQVRVEREGSALVLRAVEARGPSESALVQLLRGQAGRESDLGTVLQDLEAVLRSQPNPGPTQLAVQNALTDRIVAGQLTGEALASLLATTGTDLESLLFRLATSADSGRTQPELVRDTVEVLIRRLATSPAVAVELQERVAPLFEAALATELGQLDEQAAAPITRAGLRRFLGAYLTRLNSVTNQLEARSAEEVRLRQHLQVGLARVQAQDDGLGFLGPLLRRLLGETGESVREKLLSAVRSDFKGRLLALLSGGLPAEEHEQVSRVLESLEQDQARNLARSESGEGRMWSLALRDGQGLTTLKVFRREAGSKESGEGTDAVRFTLGVNFSQLGPLRADLELIGESLVVRVAAVDPATVERLRTQAAELQDLLGRSGKLISLRISEGTQEQVSVEKLERELGFLEHNHLLDVAA